MCNSIKGSRLYEWFVPLFQNFLDLHGEEYRSANPDDWATIGAMSRRFNEWLHALQHAPRAGVEDDDDAHVRCGTPHGFCKVSTRISWCLRLTKIVAPATVGARAVGLKLQRGRMMRVATEFERQPNVSFTVQFK
jgi:hypothetical protein